MRKYIALAIAVVALAACGTTTVSDERRTIDGIDCIVVGRSGGDGVAISCDWNRR